MNQFYLFYHLTPIMSTSVMKRILRQKKKDGFPPFLHICYTGAPVVSSSAVNPESSAGSCAAAARMAFSTASAQLPAEKHNPLA